MGTPALKAQSSDSAGGNTATIASDSYTANRLILVAVTMSRAAGSAAEKPALSGLGATWTERGDVPYGGSSRFRTTLYSTSLGSNQTGTIGISVTSAHERFLWQVVEYNDNSAFVQSASVNDGGATVTSITATLAAFADGANGAISFTSNAGSASSVTPGSGWTELGEYADGRTVQCQWRSDNDTTADVSWGGLQRAGIIAMEVAPDTTVTGSLAVTQDNQTVVASGVATASGTVAVTQGSDTAVASGWTTVSGSGAPISGNDLLTAAGSAFQPAFGSALSVPTTERVSAPRSSGYSMNMDGVWYRLAVGPGREMVIESAPLQAPQVSTAQNAEDMRSEFGTSYSRTRFDAGEGLAFAHLRDGGQTDSRRFWDSHNIDISASRPGEVPSVKLLPATSLVDAQAQTNLALATDGTAIYMSAEFNVRRSANPTNAVPTWATENPNLAEGNINVGGLVGVGTTIYAALGANGIHTRIAGTWAHWSDVAASNVWAAKATSSGAIILASGSGGTANIFYHAKAAAASVTLITLGAGETFVDCVDAGAAILVSATNGYIYALGLNSAGSALELKGQTKVSDVGYAASLAEVGGQVFYGLRVSSGSGAVGALWRAVLDTTSFTLRDSAVIRRWDHEGTGDHSVDHHPSCMVSAREGLMFGLDEGHGRTAGLWRYDLATGGRSRHLRSTVSNAKVVDTIVFSDRMFFSISGSGLWREETTYAESGWLITPAGDLFTASDKQWVGARLNLAPVTGGAVELLYSTDLSASIVPTSTKWVSLGAVRSGTLNDEIAIPSSQGRYVMGQIKITASTDRTISPAVHGVAFRAYPTTTDEMLRMPVNVSDRIESPNKRAIVGKGLGDAIYNRIKAKEGTSVTLSLLSPTVASYAGTVEKVELPVTQLSERGSPLVICWVSFRGTKSPIGGTSRARGTFGIGAFGTITFGGKQ